jgi:hypothetical protein
MVGAAPVPKWDDVLLDTSFVISLRDDARFEKFLRLPELAGRRYLIPQRVFLEYVDGSPLGREIRCGRMKSLLSKRPDVRFVPAEHDVWEAELRHPLDAMPLMERVDVAALRYLLDNPSHESFEREVGAMRKSKQRFRRVHLECRPALVRSFKT